MIATIQKLFDHGLAYQTKSGVYFSVRKFPNYGRLSGKNIEELESGARVSVDEEKEDPLDFALWKASKPDEPKWPSPWGEGRPGWHIECSAMSSKYLGQPFDIHGGGADLIFPHHENEIAQSEGACGCKFTKYWMHNGFININSEKISKSLGNIMTISEIRRRHDFEAIRYFLLSSHYRSPIDYTDTAITEASAAVDRFYEMTARLSPPSTPSPPEGDLPAGQAGGLGEVAMEKELLKSLGSAKVKIVAFMDDDFNSAGAFGVLFELIRATNKYLDTFDARPEPARLAEAPSKRVEGRNEWLSIRWKELASTFNLIFGIFGTDPAKYHERRKQIATTSKGVDSSAVENLIADRKEARKAKDFAKADAVKKQLTDMGIELKDRPDGTTEWKVK